MAVTGIYKITSPIQAVYIGQSWDINRRFNKNYKYAHLCKNQNKLYDSFRTFGIKCHTFEVIHHLPKDISQDVLNQYELLYMEAYRSTGLVMLNLRMAGSRGKHSEDTIIKMKKTFGKWMIGKKDSDETKKKKSQSAIGKKKPERSAAHSLSISLANKGKKDTPVKPVSQYNLRGEWVSDWVSIIDVQNKLNINSPNIVSVCKGARGSAGGFIWKYLYPQPYENLSFRIVCAIFVLPWIFYKKLPDFFIKILHHSVLLVFGSNKSSSLPVFSKL